MNVRADVQHILAPATQQINAIHEENPLDEFITYGHGTLDLRAEQQQDEDTKRILLWFERGSPTTGQYLTSDLKKYLKQFARLAITEGVLHRKFYNHTGNNFMKQYCVPSHFLKEVLYLIHNSVWSGHKGVSLTIAEFRKRFYFPIFTERLTEYIRNCFTCLQTKPAPTSALKPPLQQFSPQQNFLADLLLIDLVGKMHPSPYMYILSGIDVFSKYHFATPLLKCDADIVARAPVSIFLRHSYIPSRIICNLETALTS